MSQIKSKKITTPWLQCEKCSIYLTNKDSEKHLSDCPPKVDSNSINYNYIKNQTLYSTLSIKNNEEIKGLSSYDKDNMVFLSQAVIQLCSLSIGEWALICIKNKIKYAKIVWITLEKSLTSVLLTKNSLNLLNIDDSDNSFASISKLSEEELLEAKLVEVVCLNKPKSLDKSHELCNKLHKSQIGRIYCVYNQFSFMFFGKILKFHIKKIDYDHIEIENTFRKLNLSENECEEFFKITTKTSWIINDSADSTKSNQAATNKIPIIAGLDQEIQEIKQLLQNACFTNSKNSAKFKIKFKFKCKSILLYGNSGTGKSTLANLIAIESKATIININSGDLYSKYKGNADESIKKLFDKAIDNSPSIIIIDEIDILCPIRNSRLTESEKRIISTLISELDNLNNHPQNKIFIIATTNKIDSIDLSLRRIGRFDREIQIPIPNPLARKQILSNFLNELNHNLSELDLNEIASITHGYVGADLLGLCARCNYINSQKNDVENPTITLNDFKLAMKIVGPSAMREVQIESPNVKWGDIGGQEKLKLILKQAIEWPLKHPEIFTRLGINPPRGVLMFGPPGCSKTMIAKALATESGLNFLSIKGPELFSKFVGESERAVRDIFKKARQVAPSIIFFDEIDALGGERGSNSNSSNVQERVLAQLLTELDGVTPLGNVTIVAATNRPDRIDKALLRPGRLDKIVYVPLPNENTRRDILKIKLSKMPVSNVDVEELVELTKNYSGAELAAVCQEAAMAALEENLEAQVIRNEHFVTALQVITPRTPIELINLYDDYLKKTI